LVGATVAIAVLSPAARADYTVYGCALPNGAPAPLDGWTLSAENGATAQNRCSEAASGQPALYVGFAAGTATPDSHAEARFVAPPDTAIVGATLYRYFHRTSLSGSDENVFVAFGDDVPVVDCSPTPGQVCVDEGTAVAGQRFSAENRLQIASPAQHQMKIVARCQAAWTCWDASAGIAIPEEAFVYGTRLELRDLASPRFSDAPHGALLASTVAGTASVSFDAVDAGGGLASAVLLVDGRVVLAQSLSAAGGSCRPPFVRVVPCPLSGGGTITYDTRRLSDGPHRLSLGIVDVGGNRTLGATHDVLVRNGVANGVGATRRARLRGHFVGGRTVGYGRVAKLRGALTGSAGLPIGSATLEVLERTRLQGSPWRRTRSTITNRAGRFTVRLGKGPSRDVRVVYRAFSSDAQPAAQLQGRLLVRAGVRLHVSPSRVEPNGRIRFTGSLLGGPGRGGAIVTLYVFAGRRIPVAVLRTDGRGRFSFAYRFSRTFVPTTFPFWAQVEPQHGFPYVRGRSRRVLVRVL
jgi:hypothetical protein